MTTALAAIIKQGLRSVGYYRRALAHMSLPGVAVLCYHGIRDDDTSRGAIALDYLHMPASTFEGHCRIIRDCCDPISLDDWRAALHGGVPLPKRPVLITFDDGYRSVLTKAAPILGAHALPATVFVCTGPMRTRQLLWFDYVGAREGDSVVQTWKDRDYESWSNAYRETPRIDESDPRALMTPDELATLAGMSGIEIGGHTVRHPILARASASDQRWEIEQNFRDIELWTGEPVRAFAYPNGRPGIDYNADTLAILRDAGIDMAFTTRSSFAQADEPWLERSRFFMLSDTSDAELAHRLAYSWSPELMRA
jgi:peptidoglycan/xylan/chitin deacetylase (PgdA/CDA1 family)